VAASGYSRSERRYPVIYMHDGQNLFDPRTSYAEPWRVDLAMGKAGQRSLEAIVVGIPNMGIDRINEYSPWVDARAGGGSGDRYVDWVLGTVKPLVDHVFRTRPDRPHTGWSGSSMGGLITMYAYLRDPQALGFIGVMSPSLWFAGAAFSRRWQNRRTYPGGSIWTSAVVKGRSRSTTRGICATR
jgi:predicted alpha/beta superfamily hydrolase